MSEELRRRPPERTLRWVTDSIGAGSRIASMRRLTEGGWHANHALTVVDGHGRPHRLVLRRWARPEWELEDPDFTAEREALVLELLSGSSLPTPPLVAADPEAAACDVPTLLVGRLLGRPPGLPRDMGSFLSGLAQAFDEIHAVRRSVRRVGPALPALLRPRPPGTARLVSSPRPVGHVRLRLPEPSLPPDRAASSTATFTPRTRSGGVAG
jgi:hypothetical protein